MVAGKIAKKAKTATIIRPIEKKGTEGWLEGQAIEPKSEIVLYKRVSKDWKTQEGTKNETDWTPGTKAEHPDYKPKGGECGEGKFHACSRAYFCDEFRGRGKDFGGDEDRYVAIAIKKADLYAWPNPEYPHKIAFRNGRVLHECDKWGEKIEAAS